MLYPQPPPPPPLPGPTEEIAAINYAIGATSAIAAQCKDLVREYLPQIIAQIDSLPLDQVCAAIGLCPALAKQQQQQDAQAASSASRRLLARVDGSSGKVLLPGSTLRYGEEVKRQRAALRGAAAGGVGGDGMVCSFCETAVQYIKIALQNNSTIEQVGGGRGGRVCHCVCVCVCVCVCTRHCVCVCVC